MADRCLLGVYFLVTFMTLVSHVHLLVPPKTPVLSGFEPAAIGSYRELVCNADQPGAGTITYKWYKYSTNNGVENWEGKGPIGTGQKYVINPVREYHVFYQGGKSELVRGKYKCRASTSAGRRDSEWGDLYVYKPCSLYTITVSPTKPAVGSQFTISCKFQDSSGSPIIWSKRSDASSVVTELAKAGDKCLLPINRHYKWCFCPRPGATPITSCIQVTNAQTSDSGYWICHDTGLTCASNPVKITIQDPPGKPQITGFPSGPVLAGKQLNLKCVALPPGDTYDWYKDNIKLSTSLTYDFQVKKESAGVYKCVARNGAGSMTSSIKTLIVYYPPDSVVVSSEKTSSHVGEKDKFTCTATGGNPTPTLKIYFTRSGGSSEVLPQGQERVMAKEDNQATYYCEATVPKYPTLTTRSGSKTYTVTSAPVTKLTYAKREGTTMTARWVPLDRSYTEIRIKYCRQDKLDLCGYHTVTDQSCPTCQKVGETRFGIEGSALVRSVLVLNLEVFDGTVVVFRSPSITESGDVKWSATELKMVNKPNSPITVGVSVSIKCETDSSNSGSPGAISWYRNNQQITSGVKTDTRQVSDGGTIYISQLTLTARKEDNQAKYECKINDQTNWKKDVTITVHSAPVTKLTYAKRQGTTMTARWVPLDRSYTKIRIKYCRQDDLDLCGYHTVTDQTCPTCQKVGETRFGIEVFGPSLVMIVLVLYLEVFDGKVVVFRSPPLTESRDDGPNIGMIVGVTVTVVLVIVVIIVVVIVLRRRKKACFAGQKQGQSVQGQNNPTGNRDGREHMYVNLNPAFEAGESTSNMSKGENEAHHLHPGNKEPEYVNAASTVKVAGSASQDDDEAHYLQPHKKETEYVNLTPTVKEVTYDDTVPPPSGGNKVDHTNVQNLSIEEFKTWLLSKDVTKPTYNTLTKHGLHKPKFFVMLQQQHLERLRIRPMAQEILVQKLVESLQSSNQPTLGEATADVEEYGIYSEPYDIPDNLHAANVTPDVIAEPSYINLT